MASAVALALLDPVIKGFRSELKYTGTLKSKPGSFERIKDIPGGFAAFGRGFVGADKDDERSPNNNVSNSGNSQMG